MDDYLKQILAYEAGELSQDRRVAFEQALTTDRALRSVYEQWKSTEQLRDTLAYDELRSELRQMQQQRTKIRNWQKPLAIAAGFFLLLSAALFLYAQANFSNSKIVASVYTLPNFSLNRTDEVMRDYDKAIVAFNEKRYQDCILLLKSSNLPQEQYLLGHAALLSKNNEQAISSFSNLAVSEDVRFKEPAQWFEILALLGAGEVEQANTKMFAIQNSHPYYQEMIQLRKNLEHPLRSLIW